MDFVNLVPITLFILLIGHYFITITTIIRNWIYIRYMRPLKIEDARIVSEEQQQDEEDDNVKLDSYSGDIGKYNGLLDGKTMNPVDGDDGDGDEKDAEAFIDYSRHNHSDEDEHYNYYVSVNGNSYSGPDYNFNDGDW